MLDCGFSTREICRRIEHLHISPEHINAVLVTHEHGDHSRGVARFARRYDVPVWCSKGTSLVFEQEDMDCRTINLHQSWTIGDIHVTPVAVPHDAREPCQFIFTHHDQTLGVLTDVGEITPYIRKSYQPCNAMLLEFNHDLDMLWDGDYAPALKKRVAGRLGHLNNTQSMELLESMKSGPLRFVLAAHLSESNNCAELVSDQLSQALGQYDCDYAIAKQDQVSDWFSVGELC